MERNVRNDTLHDTMTELRFRCVLGLLDMNE
jgi:hypothetical protein